MENRPTGTRDPDKGQGNKAVTTENPEDSQGNVRKGMEKKHSGSNRGPGMVHVDSVEERRQAQRLGMKEKAVASGRGEGEEFWPGTTRGLERSSRQT